MFKIKETVLLVVLMFFLQTTFADDEHYESIYADNVVLIGNEELPRSSISKEIHEEIKTVLISDDFAQKETVTNWRFINSSEKVNKESKIPEWIIKILEFIEQNDQRITLFSQIIEVGLWLIGGLLIIWLFIRYRKSIYQFVSNFNQTTEDVLPTTMFGLDVKKESLPDDIITSAKSLWAQQKRRPAVALLLRARLITLLHEYKVRLVDSDTETECCMRIEQQAPSKVTEYMRTLVSQWQLIAYAHQSPSNSDFDALCQQWQKVF